MSQIELFNIQTEYKQMIHAELNCLKKNCLITQLCVNKFMFNWIVINSWTHMTLAYAELLEIELFDHLTACRQMTDASDT